MTINTVTPHPIFLASIPVPVPFPATPVSRIQPAIHQYQTKYPDASLLMICTW